MNKIGIYLQIMLNHVKIFFNNVKLIALNAKVKFLQLTSSKSIKAAIARRLYEEPGIPSHFENRIFMQNPATEDLISGSKLKNGMIVLIHDVIFNDYREYEDEATREPYGYSRLLTDARWARVTELTGNRRNGELINFIAVYADGTKHNRTYSNLWCWYVKRSSIPTK